MTAATSPVERLAAKGRLRRQRDQARSLTGRFEGENAELLRKMGRAAEFLKTLPCECVERGVMVQTGPDSWDPDGWVETCGRCAALSDLEPPKSPAAVDAMTDEWGGDDVAPF